MIQIHIKHLNIYTTAPPGRGKPTVQEENEAELRSQIVQNQNLKCVFFFFTTHKNVAHILTASDAITSSKELSPHKVSKQPSYVCSLIQEIMF